MQFPHHENEIAQSEAAHSCQMANYWMHNGFVRVDDEKMSKSLDNFFTIREVLKVLTIEYRGDEQKAAEVIRFFILRAHYRSPLNYSNLHLDDAYHALYRLYSALNCVPNIENLNIPIDWNNSFSQRFKSAMDDDFNTSEVMALFHDLATEINKTKSGELAYLLKNLGEIIGLLQLDPAEFLQGRDLFVDIKEPLSVTDSVDATVSFSKVSIESRIQMRIEAKKTKNFAEADRIRKELADAGIILEDTPQGTTWRRA